MPFAVAFDGGEFSVKIFKVTLVCVSLYFISTWLVVVGAMAEVIGDAGQLQVLKKGDSVYLRSCFSKERDLVVALGRGANGQVNFSSTYLLAHEVEMEESQIKRGELIHWTGDDSTPWKINGTYIGANHGCSGMLEVTSTNNSCTVADVGSEWNDGLGEKFYLIKVLDHDRLWFLSRNAGMGAIWRFNLNISGNILRKVKAGIGINIVKRAIAQLHPALRIKRQDYLLNGTIPLRNEEVSRCDFMEIIDEHEVINPGAVLADIIQHPGVECDFASSRLDAVISNRIIYRFYPNGSVIIDHTARALQEFNLGYMGFVQSTKLVTGSFATHEYYIPKTLPFDAGENHYDFSSIQNFNVPIPVPLRFGILEKNLKDAVDLPDRFVQLLGKNEGGTMKKQVGFAFGYSLNQGLTQPKERSGNSSEAFFIHTSSKTYPIAINDKMGNPIPAGSEFHCVAYRQYFNPSFLNKATSFYWHKEGDGYVVYVDYHCAVEHDVIVLPPILIGKRMSVCEKTDSMELHSVNMVTESKLEFSVKGNYGSITLRLQ